MIVQVKSSQREQNIKNERGQGSKSYDLWLEVAIRHNGKQGNWCTQVDGPSSERFDTAQAERHFWCWLGLTMFDQGQRIPYPYTKPLHSTPKATELARQITSFLLS